MISEASIQEEIIKNIFLNDSTIKQHIQSIVRQINHQAKLQNLRTQQKNYPWNNNIETNTLISEIEQLINNLIQQNLHSIIDKQFIQFSDEFIKMRDQFTQMQQQHENRFKYIHEDFMKEIQSIKKKIATSQATINNTPKYSRTSAPQSSKSIQLEMSQLKVEIEKLRESNSKIQQSNDHIHHISALQKMVGELKTQLKIKIEQIKQKNTKSIQNLQIKINQMGSKEIISKEVKLAMKVNQKVYNQQLQKIKKMIRQKNDESVSDNFNIQDYIGSQLKSAWLIISNLKRRLEKIEESCNIMNNSFIME